MFCFLAAITMFGGGAPCEAPLPRGPAVPAPIVLSTDCGWFRLATNGAVTRLPSDWLVTHKQSSEPHYTIRRPRSGRYIVLWNGREVWRSQGRYFNEAGDSAFGPGAFAFYSSRRHGLFLTDLRSPERLVLREREGWYPIGFTSKRELLVAGREAISVLSGGGEVVRRLPLRWSSSFDFDERSKTVYFVTPRGMLSAAQGSTVRQIRRTSERGWIGLLGRRLLTFTTPRRLAIVRRDDGSLVASATWRGEFDSEVAVSDDGRTFAFRVVKPSGTATVYLLRAGEHRAHAVHRHRFLQAGCGYSVGLDPHDSSFLYRSDDGSGVTETAVLTAGGSVVELTPVLRALPRKSAGTPGNAFWEAAFPK